MNREAVESSHLMSVGYDTDSLTLEVEFQDSSIYQYFDVPEMVWRELMQASSKGVYFHANIRDSYRYVKL